MKILPAAGAVSESLWSLKVYVFILLNVCTIFYLKKKVQTNTIVENTNINVFNQLCFM